MTRHRTKERPTPRPQPNGEGSSIRFPGLEQRISLLQDTRRAIHCRPVPIHRHCSSSRSQALPSCQPWEARRTSAERVRTARFFASSPRSSRPASVDTSSDNCRERANFSIAPGTFMPSGYGLSFYPLKVLPKAENDPAIARQPVQAFQAAIVLCPDRKNFMRR